MSDFISELEHHYRPRFDQYQDKRLGRFLSWISASQAGYDTPGKTPRTLHPPGTAFEGAPRQKRMSCSTSGHSPGAGPSKRRPGFGEAPPTFKALLHPDPRIMRADKRICMLDGLMPGPRQTFKQWTCVQPITNIKSQASLCHCLEAM